MSNNCSADAFGSIHLIPGRLSREARRTRSKASNVRRFDQWWERNPSVTLGSQCGAFQIEPNAFTLKLQAIARIVALGEFASASNPNAVSFEPILR